MDEDAVDIFVETIQPRIGSRYSLEYACIDQFISDSIKPVSRARISVTTTFDRFASDDFNRSNTSVWYFDTCELACRMRVLVRIR